MEGIELFPTSKIKWLLDLIPLKERD